MRSFLPSPCAGFVLVLGACAPVQSWPHDEVIWREAVLTAAGDAQTESIYERRTHALSRTTWGMRTIRTEGEVRVGSAEPLRFDSALPRPSDPWALRWQHAISAVPAAVLLDDHGRPVALVEPAQWQVDAAAAVSGLAAPIGTRQTSRALLDPEGFIADLARSFPGAPPQAAWTRVERVAGVVAERRELCARAGRRDGGALWRCDGACVALSKDGPQLHDTECWTEVWMDHAGLLGVESGYSGTRVRAQGGLVGDDAVAGQRLAVRRTP